MPGGLLELSFSPDDEWSGFLTARAEANGFAGAGRAYFNNDELLAFAASLQEFPMKGRPTVRGGYPASARTGAREEVHLELTCYPVSGRGHIGVEVRLGSHGVTHAVTLQIVTVYEPLARFAKELRSLVNGEREEAVLRGEV